MISLKTSLKALLAGLIVVVAMQILDDNGYSYFDFIYFIKSYLNF